MGTRNMALRSVVLVVLFALAGSLVSAQPPAGDPNDQRETAQLGEGVVPLGVLDEQPYHYMVKFVCGDALVQEILPPLMGYYFTAINIGNYTGHSVRIYYRPLGHYGNYSAAGIPPVYGVTGLWIKPRRDFQIDCVDIWFGTQTDAYGLAKGILHISMAEKLPVVAVYTVATGKDMVDATWDQKPRSIDVEYIQPFSEP